MVRVIRVCITLAVLLGCAQDLVFIEPQDVGPRDGGALDRATWKSFEPQPVLLDPRPALSASALSTVRPTPRV